MVGECGSLSAEMGTESAGQEVFAVRRCAPGRARKQRVGWTNPKGSNFQPWSASLIQPISLSRARSEMLPIGLLGGCRGAGWWTGLPDSALHRGAKGCRDTAGAVNPSDPAHRRPRRLAASRSRLDSASIINGTWSPCRQRVS